MGRRLLVPVAIAMTLCVIGYLALRRPDPTDWHCRNFRGWREMPSGGLIVDCSNNIDWEWGADPWFGTKNPGRRDPLTLGNLRALKKALTPGAVAIDFGTGTGFFAFHMLDLVGPTGKVHAIDISDDMVALMRETARVTGRSNLHVMLADERFGDSFAPGSIDVINANGLGLSCAGMERFIASCARTLKPAGVVLYDFASGDANYAGDEPCGIRETSKLLRNKAMALEQVPSAQLLHALRRQQPAE